jgi:3-oxoacyl-[acyl-carrier protein] reductase
MTNTTLKKPSALVTGASRGIGAAIAKKLAQKGYFVWVNYASHGEEAKKVVTEIQAHGGEAQSIQFDVSDPSAVDQAFEQIAKDSGSLSVLVNNAGINRDGLILRLKDEDIENLLAINLKGTIYCTRAASKQMLRNKKGSIIQISSVVGETGNPGQSVYSATKAGIIGFSKSIAKELATRKIRVNVVTPGYIQTEMTEVLTEEQKEEILRRIPLGSMGSPEDVAECVAFLASDSSQYITGQIIGVNGGLYI